MGLVPNYFNGNFSGGQNYNIDKADDRNKTKSEKEGVKK